MNVSFQNGKRVTFQGGDTNKLIIRNTRINACELDVFGFRTIDITNSSLVDPTNVDCGNKNLESSGVLEFSEVLLYQIALSSPTWRFFRFLTMSRYGAV